MYLLTIVGCVAPAGAVAMVPPTLRLGWLTLPAFVVALGGFAWLCAVSNAASVVLAVIGGLVVAYALLAIPVGLADLIDKEIADRRRHDYFNGRTPT